MPDGLATLLILSASLATGWRVRRWLRRRVGLSKQTLAVDVAQCPCGYPLSGLNAARCPECGRVIGFDRTAEELGLNTEQLERIMRARLRRQEQEQFDRA